MYPKTKGIFQTFTVPAHKS